MHSLKLTGHINRRKKHTHTHTHTHASARDIHVGPVNTVYISSFCFKHLTSDFFVFRKLEWRTCAHIAVKFQTFSRSKQKIVPFSIIFPELEKAPSIFQRCSRLSTLCRNPGNLGGKAADRVSASPSPDRISAGTKPHLHRIVFQRGRRLA